MSLELTMLLWTAILAAVQMLIAASGTSLQFGLPWAVGNRETTPPLTGWAGRALRAHRNMLESLVLFAILILITEVTNKNNYMTGLGAQIFFWSRLAYAIIYIIGIPWLRTLVWAASFVGLILILIQLPLI